ncbi:MAG: glycosyl hydrolase [Gemmatimonadaceae bacterium]
MQFARLALAATLALPCAAALGAQRAAPVTDSGRVTFAPSYLNGLRWRNVGPHRGGRAVAVAGDPTRPRTFYMGSVDGGVWKTVNAGATWKNISDYKSTIASVGALAVAPSDPNVIWVGSGEADFREDLTYGDGIWRSTDAGATWQHAGLDDARHISVIRVDPRNADVAFVAATGHAFGPNATRGVYRTRDGGKSWQRILFVNDSTGAIDIALDPSNARILFAAMWQFQRFPWGFSAGGATSGLYKSTDGGDTWTDISDNPGMPKGDKGRIGVSVSGADPQRVYASVEASDSSGGIFRSDDAGASWKRVSGDQKFQIRPWYFSGTFADPQNANTLYVLNLGTWRSTDGGQTWLRLRVPHGDCHTLWIDPADPKRMIEGNDGGATVSMDGGETWSSIYNQPTAQFYHVTTDNQFPYRIYGAQQDNSTVSIASRSDDGSIGRGDFYNVGGGESGYIAPKPADPNVVFAGTYMGEMTRYDHRTRQAQDVSVTLNNYDGYAAKDVPYRFQWTFPIAWSLHEANTIYVTSQYVHKSTDAGHSWQKISPDLTLHDPATLGAVGGPLTKDMTGTEWYATIFAFAESPLTSGVMWTGSDDGLVHLSRDNGATWANVTPKGLGKFTRMSIIEPSHFDAATAYIAANRYQQDDAKPYLYKTTDYGKTWTKIVRGIPDGAYTRAIREDPVRRGLLFAGTETGAYVSFDDGENWQTLQINLPITSVRDLHVHGSDLIAATHGRAFWVLDDISALRQMSDAVRRAPAHLFAPDSALRWRGGRDGPQADAGQNPPSGVVVDYWLREKPSTVVKLEFLDAAGVVIRAFSSTTAEKRDSAADSLKVRSDSAARMRDTTGLRGRKRRIEVGDTVSIAIGDTIVPARAGVNRFVWNLRYPDAKQLKEVVTDEGILTGPALAPGTYTVRLAANGQTLTRPFTVVMDPRVPSTRAELEQQLALARRVVERINDVTQAVTDIEAAQQQLDLASKSAAAKANAAQVSASAKSLRAKLEAVRAELTEVACHADECTLIYPIKLYNKLISLNYMVQSADAAPTAASADVYTNLAAQLDDQLGKLAQLQNGDIAAFNKMIRDLDIPAVNARPVKPTLVP